MLIAEFIQRIQSMYSHGVQSDDSRLTNQHIYNKLCTVRKSLLSQKSKKNQKISPWTYQTIPCIPLILAPINECPCNIPNTCNWLRSRDKIPTPITNLDGNLMRVTSSDGSQNFDVMEFTQVKYSGGNKYVKFKPNYVLRNQYLFITDNKLLEAVSMELVAEDPIAVEKFILACECTPRQDCTSNLAKNFPIDGDLEEPLIALTLEELVKDFYSTPEDRFNDSVDNNSKVAK